MFLIVTTHTLTNFPLLPIFVPIRYIGLPIYINVIVLCATALRIWGANIYGLKVCEAKDGVKILPAFGVGVTFLMSV